MWNLRQSAMPMISMPSPSRPMTAGRMIAMGALVLPLDAGVGPAPPDDAVGDADVAARVDATSGGDTTRTVTPA